MPFGLIGSAISGIAGAVGAGSAAGVQSGAYRDAANKMLPFLQTGQTASSVLGTEYGIGADGTWNQAASFLQPIESTIGAPPSPTDPSLRTSFQASPGYNYLLQQGADAVQNSAATKTGAISGNMLKGLQTNAAGLASQDWGNWYQQLVNSYNQRYKDYSTTRSGTTAALENMAGLGANAAQTYGSDIIGAGSATATGITGATRALTSPLSNSSNYNALLNLLGYGGSDSTSPGPGTGGYY
jgi:hypothetical protein